MNKISLCMIVKNEEKNLESCLNSIAAFMDEIVIVDTGSVDRTKEIAFQYTNQVYDYIWINDFAAARNYSISKASNEYILVIDSDEETVEIDIEGIKSLMEKHPMSIGRVCRINEYVRENRPYKYSESVNRLFSKRCYKYEGIIHEQLIWINDAIPWSNDAYQIPLKLRHRGYEGDLDTRKKKTQRNIFLLLEALKIHPSDPYLLYQIGKSLYMEEDYINAAEYFGQALGIDVDIKLEYVQDMVESYGYSLINSRQFDKSMQLINIYDEFSHSADFIFMIALVLMNNGCFKEAIKEFEKAIDKQNCKMEGVNSYLSYYNIAVIYECLGDMESAKGYYSKCENYVRLIGRKLPY